MSAALRARRLAPALALAAGLALHGGETPPADAAGDWLLPLAHAAAPAIGGQPAVLAADADRRSQRLSVDQARARWSPALTLSGAYDENRRLSTSRVDGQGVVVDRGAQADAVLAKSFSTGTVIEVRGGSEESRSTSASRLDDLVYTSDARLVLTQPLLKGRSRVANRAEEDRAWDAWRDAEEALFDTVEERFAALARDWIDLVQRRIEVATREVRLNQARASLTRAESRVAVGLGRGSELPGRRRDVVAQEAALAQAKRSRELVEERIRLQWGAIELPPGEALLGVAGRLRVPTGEFADTRAGAAARRRLAAAERELQVARALAYDRLDLAGSYGRIGTDETFSGSWGEVAGQETFRWSASLTWIHRFGLDRDRVGAARAALAVERERAAIDAAERDWRVERARRAQGFTDALERFAEQERVLAALREEERALRAEADAGLIPVQNLLGTEQAILEAELDRQRSYLDVLRADVALRDHDDHLSELLP